MSTILQLKSQDYFLTVHKKNKERKEARKQKRKKKNIIYGKKRKKKSVLLFHVTSLSMVMTGDIFHFSFFPNFPILGDGMGITLEIVFL